MFSSLKFWKKKPANEPEKKETEPKEPHDISQFFSTHLLRSKQQKAAILENPFLAMGLTTPDDFKVFDSSGMDDVTNTNTQPAKAAFRIGRQILPDNLFFWYVTQSFIGYQACAFVAQHWLVDRACSMKGRDAIRNGWQMAFDEGLEVDPKVTKKIEKWDKKFKLRKLLETADKFKNVFGISHILFMVDSDDPDYYSKPFNPDGIRTGRYKGLVRVDPYWISPLLTTEAVEHPDSQSFYEPTFWIISGQKYHKSHFVILRGPEVADILKPSYLYGGIPLTQRIIERVYAAERTANEAPQLALSKRLVIRYIDKFEQAIANQGKFEEAMQVLTEWRDNYGVFVDDAANRIEQQDTSLGDLDTVIMTQYQIVAGQAGIPATKLMGTAPKGFQATGEHEIKMYHEELESIRENDLTPIIDKHHLCLMRSHIAPTLPDKQPITVDITWNPLSVSTDKELAETAELKARTYQTLQNTGAIDEYDIRDAIIKDETSPLSGIEAVERPDELTELTIPEPEPAGGGFGFESADEEHTKDQPEAINPPADKPDPRVRTTDFVQKKGTKWFVMSPAGEKIDGPYRRKPEAVKRLRELVSYNEKGQRRG